MYPDVCGGEVGDHNRSDVGFIAAESPSSSGRQRKKNSRCHFALDPPPIHRPPGSGAAASTVKSASGHDGGSDVLAFQKKTGQFLKSICYRMSRRLVR